MSDDKDEKIQRLEEENARLTQHIIEQAHWMAKMATTLTTTYGPKEASELIVAREQELLATRKDLALARAQLREATPRTTHVMPMVDDKVRLSTVMVKASMAKNRGEAHALIGGGAVKVNGIRASHDVQLEEGSHMIIVGSDTRQPTKVVLIEESEEICPTCFAFVQKGYLDQHKKTHEK